jgi:hypothetical protein
MLPKIKEGSKTFIKLSIHPHPQDIGKVFVWSVWRYRDTNHADTVPSSGDADMILGFEGRT